MCMWTGNVTFGGTDPYTGINDDIGTYDDVDTVTIILILILLLTLWLGVNLKKLVFNRFNIIFEHLF